MALSESKKIFTFLSWATMIVLYGIMQASPVEATEKLTQELFKDMRKITKTNTSRYYDLKLDACNFLEMGTKDQIPSRYWKDDVFNLEPYERYQADLTSNLTRDCFRLKKRIEEYWSFYNASIKDSLQTWQWADYEIYNFQDERVGTDWQATEKLSLLFCTLYSRLEKFEKYRAALSTEQEKVPGNQELVQYLLENSDNEVGDLEQLLSKIQFASPTKNLNIASRKKHLTFVTPRWKNLDGKIEELVEFYAQFEENETKEDGALIVQLDSGWKVESQASMIHSVGTVELVNTPPYPHAEARFFDDNDLELKLPIFDSFSLLGGNQSGFESRIEQGNSVVFDKELLEAKLANRTNEIEHARANAIRFRADKYAYLVFEIG